MSDSNVASSIDGHSNGLRADIYEEVSETLRARWLAFLVGFEVFLLVGGFTLDALAGPTKGPSDIVHLLAGLAGALAVLVAVIGLLGVVVLVYLTVASVRRRYRSN
jgi:uncharacterized membrane protein YdcZ (DUF606 family)